MKIIIDNNVIPTDSIIRVRIHKMPFSFTIELIGQVFIEIKRDSTHKVPEPKDAPKRYDYSMNQEYNAKLDEYFESDVYKEYCVQRNLRLQKDQLEVARLYDEFMKAWRPKSRFYNINQIVKPVE